MAATTSTLNGNSNFFSSSGCKKPRQPASSAIPTSGIIIKKPSGNIYHGDPFGVPHNTAKSSATKQKNAVSKIVFNLFSVCKIRWKNVFSSIFSRHSAKINTDKNGAGVENTIPITAYAKYPNVNLPVCSYWIAYDFSQKFSVTKVNVQKAIINSKYNKIFDFIFSFIFFSFQLITSFLTPPYLRVFECWNQLHQYYLLYLSYLF